MLTPNQVYQINIALARSIHLDLARDPHSRYAGKWIGIANGQVVVVGNSHQEVSRCLDEIEPNPRRTFCLEGVGITEKDLESSYGDYGE